MVDPITMTAPTVEQIVAQAQARGMSASNTFSLESDSRYTIMSLRVNKEADLNAMASGIAALDDIDACTLVGDHVTAVAPSGKQVEAQVRVKIRLSNAPQQEVVE